MKLDAKLLVPPLLAVLVLFLTLRLTADALRHAGAWQRAEPSRPRPEDPYARIDQRIAGEHIEVDPGALRDPFAFGLAPRPQRDPVRRPTPPEPVVPAGPPRPVLTSITWSDDADPRATLRYNGRDYSVSVNMLFDDLLVRSISKTQVVLERNGEPVVLTLRSKGE